MIAKVIVDIAHPDVDRLFDYAVPAGMDAQRGSRVLVPFGSRRKEGMVLSVGETTEVPPEKLRAISKLLDDAPVLGEEDFAIAAYLTERYNATMAQALRLLLPTKLRGGRTSIHTENHVELAVGGEAYERAVESLLKKDGTPRSPRQMEVLEKLKMAPQGIRMADLPSSAVRALLKKGYVRQRTAVVSRVLSSPPARPGAWVPEELSGDQQAALYTILHSGRRRFLLFGVTGSGKTEVYIRIIRHLLSQGKTAILLVPEISLTPQVYEYLRKRLDAEVALFHSRLTEAERYQQWRRVKDGKARVVIGPRSAVFAPLENLGAVIIDEEHEEAYKSESYPPYTAKEIAELRCERSDALLIVGSATPSLGAFREALEEDLTLIEMPKRLFGLPLPPVEIVDMRKEAAAGNSGLISSALDEAVQEALRRHEQIMILLNRRGHSSFLMCPACGHVVQCGDCDISMTYHKSEGMLKCHYCGARAEVPAVCPACGSDRLRKHGFGTQKLEEELRRLYPAARILRMDTDTMSGRDAHLKAYEKFRDGDADILIGTQMIAKGFDFERVSVAAILGVDSMLHMPDYRSAERTFDLMTQLAGRAGRQRAGRVFVQTYTPEHYAVLNAAQHDYKGFFEEESAFRRSMHLPPYGAHILVRFQSTHEEDAKNAVRDFFTRLRPALGPYMDDIMKVRASESPVRRAKGQFRYQILLHLRNPASRIPGVLKEMLNSTHYRNVLTGLYINPASMA